MRSFSFNLTYLGLATYLALAAYGVTNTASTIFDHPLGLPNIDISLVETAWNRVNDWIFKHCPEKVGYDELRLAVKGAWETFPIDALQDLVRGMGKHRQAVIDAHGGHVPC
jgi:hypothetical protein